MRGTGKDRRVARTRTALQHALLALMLKKGYNDVTVEDICAEADVGRSTFYAHFSSKEDLKRAGLDQHLKSALRDRTRQAAADGAAVATGEMFGFTLAFFEHAHAHRELYRALTNKGGVQTTLAMVRQIVVEQLRRELKGGRSNAAETELIVQFFAGALMALLASWLDSGARQSPQYIDGLFSRLAAKGMRR